VWVDELVKAGVKKRQIAPAVAALAQEYEPSAIEIVDMGGTYVMQLKNTYADRVKRFAPMELSESVLRTLAIIAYHQPVLQSALKQMVGSSVYDHVRELREKGFIKAKKEGRTKNITVTPYFYDYFGFGKKDREKIKEVLYEKIRGKD
jgi:segregation and condensation protein B